MPSLKKMKKMNYAEAWEFFMENERMGSPEATDYLKYISRKSFVYDMRGKEITSDGIYEGSWLIILDGVSCSGKSTIAKKIGKKFPETVEVIDIDYLFSAWVHREAEKITRGDEKNIFLNKIEKQGDEYLKLNLENIIANRARDGKTVVLVWCFLETIYRAFLGTIFGKYFENVAIFTIYEEMTTLKEYQESREEDFGNPGGKVLQEQVDETSKQYSFLKQVINLQPFVLGFGADVSFLINSETKLY